MGEWRELPPLGDVRRILSPAGVVQYETQPGETAREARLRGEAQMEGSDDRPADAGRVRRVARGVPRPCAALPAPGGLRVIDIDIRPWWESPLCAVFYRDTPEDRAALERDALRARELGCTVGIHEGQEIALSFGGSPEAREAFGREIERRWSKTA